VRRAQINAGFHEGLYRRLFISTYRPQWLVEPSPYSWDQERARYLSEPQPTDVEARHQVTFQARVPALRGGRLFPFRLYLAQELAAEGLLNVQEAFILCPGAPLDDA